MTDKKTDMNRRTFISATMTSVGHEFVPKNDPLASLAQAVHICDV